MDARLITKEKSDLLEHIDVRTTPRRMTKKEALDILEDVRDGVVSRIEALKDEISDDDA